MASQKKGLPIFLSESEDDHEMLIEQGFATQRANLERYAKMIEAGQLPSENGEISQRACEFVALFLRRAAAAHRAPTKKRAGRPAIFNKNKLVAEVGALVRDGVHLKDALARISTRERRGSAAIEKAYHEASESDRLAAADFWFPVRKK